MPPYSHEGTPDIILAALKKSIFGIIPSQTLGPLSVTLRTVPLGAGELVYDPEVAIVTDGLVRAFIADETGRQLTVGYLHPGRAIALARLAGRDYPTAFQAIADSKLVLIGNERTSHLLRQHPRLGWSIAQELGSLINGLEAEIARVAFGSLRQRLAHHLLAMIDTTTTTPIHLARLTTAVGSPREVVSRTLAPWASDGIIRVDAAGVTILDPVALRHQTHAPGR